jgi:hypothetical protein
MWSPTPPTPPVPPTPSWQPGSEGPAAAAPRSAAQERLRILEAVRTGELTIEEAERRLDTLERSER